jgi:hypothetical protein
MGYGKLSLGESILARRRCPRLFGNRVTRIFGPVWWRRRSFSSAIYGNFSINDGSRIRFWEDTWLDNAPLWEQYPALYNIVHHKSYTIATVMATSPPNVMFRRDLLGPWLASWNTLLHHLDSLQLLPGLMYFIGIYTPMTPFW